MQKLTERSVSGCAFGCTQSQFTLTERFSLNATNGCVRLDPHGA